MKLLVCFLFLKLPFFSFINGQIGYSTFNVITNNSSYSSDIFIHTMGPGSHHMAIINPELEIKWFIKSGHLGIDFKVSEDFLSYFDKNNNSWILLDKFMIEKDTLSFAGANTDYHDIKFLPDGGYILQAYDSTYVDMGNIIENGQWANVVFLRIQEFNQNHNLIFEWSSWDHLDISDYTNLNLTSNYISWMHGNSIEIDNADNNLILSNRTSSEIIKIDRNTGEVIWFFGGPNNQFTITNDTLGGFSMQHDVRLLNNGNLTLFDNGNHRDPPVSRVSEYFLDTTNMTAELVWDFIHPNNYYGVAMGSAQRLPNQNTLISWGIITQTANSDLGTIITEVDYDKNIVLEIIYPFNHNNYRVSKNNWAFQSNLIPGDTNLDNVLNIMDVINIIDYMHNNPKKDVFHLYRFDLNRDNTFDNNDIYQLTNKLLNN